MSDLYIAVDIMYLLDGIPYLAVHRMSIGGTGGTYGFWSGTRLPEASVPVPLLLWAQHWSNTASISRGGVHSFFHVKLCS